MSTATKKNVKEEFKMPPGVPAVDNTMEIYKTFYIHDFCCYEYF